MVYPPTRVLVDGKYNKIISSFMFDNFDTFDRTEVISLKWPRLGLMWMSSEEMALISNIFSLPCLIDVLLCSSYNILEYNLSSVMS